MSDQKSNHSPVHVANNEDRDFGIDDEVLAFELGITLEQLHDLSKEQAERLRQLFLEQDEVWTRDGFRKASEIVRCNPSGKPLDPKQLALAFFRFGEVCLTAKDFDGAITELDKGIRHDPTCAYAFRMRGLAWQCKKEYSKAIKDFHDAIRLNFSDTLSYAALAWLLATCPEEKVRDGKHSIQLATKACEITHWKSARELEIWRRHMRQRVNSTKPCTGRLQR
jgi:tetratricopeptide (TPR) repeat protein